MPSLCKKNGTVEPISPIKGKVVQLLVIPDPVFSSNSMGDVLAIVPDEGVVYSPANGVVTDPFPTKHAIGILTDEGIEILIHAGIDTVNLDGEGFQSYVRENDRVKSKCVKSKCDLFRLIWILQEKC